MCEWDWATILTITGAVLEVAGLGFVFTELAFIRSHEFGTPPPWERAKQRLRRLLRRPVVVELAGAASVSVSAGGARGVVRPSEPLPEATDRERIERLEEYVRRIDDDLSAMSNTMREYRDAAIAEARKRDDQVRREIERREDDRKAKLRPSLTRQKWGALLVFAGLAIGTVGNVI